VEYLPTCPTAEEEKREQEAAEELSRKAATRADFAMS